MVGEGGDYGASIQYRLYSAEGGYEHIHEVYDMKYIARKIIFETGPF